jgi:hypothetical protein
MNDKLLRRSWSSSLIPILLAMPIAAQRAFEKGPEVVYEDSEGKQVNVGVGLSPQLTLDGKIALIRGHSFGYGEPFDCGKKDRKNWIVVYNPLTRSEGGSL